jgi:hypothetical protein
MIMGCETAEEMKRLKATGQDKLSRQEGREFQSYRIIADKT